MTRYDQLMRSFMDMCLDGIVGPNDIDKFVDEWHDLRDCEHGAAALHEHLGMTHDEYARWVEDPNVLPGIIADRRTT